MSFSYEVFTTRNIGFVTPEEQNLLRQARVFIPGVGGMGGTALEALVRTGFENFLISDLDQFEVSNLNRQIFSDLDQIGRDKAQVAKEKLLKINPQVKVQIWGPDWTSRLDEILPQVDLVINGCDDVKATVQMMRKAKAHGKTVIDAFASTLPSVYVVRPQDPRPEEFMGYPTKGLSWEDITAEVQKESAFCEMVYVLANSSTLRHVVLQYAQEMVSGKRKRISIAPMVWMTGLLMAYEALKIVLAKETLADHRGVFLNPWKFRYERPLPSWISNLKAVFVRIFLKKLASGT